MYCVTQTFNPVHVIHMYGWRIDKNHHLNVIIRRVWRYQRGNQNPQIIEGQKTQYPKKKGQKDKQRPILHHRENLRSSKTNPAKNRGWTQALRKGKHRSEFTPARNPAISHEREKDRGVLTTIGTYPLSFVTQIFHNGQPSHCGTMTSTFSCKQQPSIKEILIETTSSGISDQLIDIYSICSCCGNVATYKWKVRNRKNEIISFVVKVRSYPVPTVNHDV